MIGRGHRRRLLAVLGDRGHVERSSRYRSRATTSHRWAAAAFTFYIASRVIGIAYPDEAPDVAVTTYYVLMVASAVCLAIFLALRARMWFQGDDLEGTERSASPTER